MLLPSLKPSRENLGSFHHPQSPACSKSCLSLCPYPLATPICWQCPRHTCINSASWIHQACATTGPFHLRFLLRWAVGVLLGGLLDQELLFLLETLGHLLSHCSHTYQVCLWVQEALGAPAENNIISEAFLQKYHNAKILHNMNTQIMAIVIHTFTV